MEITKYRIEMVKETSYNYESGILTEDAISNTEKAFCSFEKVFRLSNQAEEVVALLVANSKLNIIGAFEVSRGSINSSIFSPPEILKRVLLCNGNRFYLAHNHPSGDVTPSSSDITSTKGMNEAANLLKLDLVDHLIIGDGKFFSMRAEYPDLF